MYMWAQCIQPSHLVAAGHDLPFVAAQHWVLACFFSLLRLQCVLIRLSAAYSFMRVCWPPGSLHQLYRFWK